MNLKLQIREAQPNNRKSIVDVRRSVPFFALLVMVCAIGCVDREAQKQAKRTSELSNDATVPVSVQPAETRNLFQNLTVTGQIATSQITSVGAKINGKISAVYVRDGQQVKAGQLIASQDTANLSISLRQASAQAAQARAALQQALANKAIGPSKSKAAVASAEAALRAAKAQLDKARSGARSEEVKQAEYAVAAAKSTMETAKKEWERQQYMLNEGATSKQAVENAENAYRTALANYETAVQSLRMMQNWTRPEDIRAAEEQVRQAEEQLRTAQSQQKLDVLYDQQVDAARAAVRGADAQVDIARRNIADAQITSPFDGNVSGQPLQVGTFAGAGTIVARIVGSGGNYFEGQVPESDINSVNIGDPVTVELDAIKGRRYNGSVDAIDPLGDDVARLYKVRISIGSSSQEIKPGMFARGTITLKKIPGAIVVPATAVIRRGNEAYVFIADGNKAMRKDVELGLADDGMIQVIGIAAQSPVIVRGQTQLVDGSSIRVESENSKLQTHKENGALHISTVHRQSAKI